MHYISCQFKELSKEKILIIIESTKDFNNYCYIVFAFYTPPNSNNVTHVYF